MSYNPNEVPLSSNIVVGNSDTSGSVGGYGAAYPGASQQGYAAQGQEYYSEQPYGDPQSYAYPPPEPKVPPVFDAVESSKMTPQILVLLLMAGLKRNWKWALPLGLVLGSVAFATLYTLFPKKYEAKAWIQIFSQKPHFIFDEKQQRQYENLVQTQFALIRSPLIIEKALENPQVASLKCITDEEDKAGWLTKELRLQTQGRSEVITVSIETADARGSEIIVNSVIDAYFDYYENQSQEWNAKLVAQLQLELNRQQSAAKILQEEIRSNMEKAAKKGGAAGSEGGMGAGFSPGESLRRDVYIAESKLDSLKAELKMLEDSRNDMVGNVPRSMVESIISSDTQIMQYDALLKKLKEELAKQKDIIVNDNDPKIARLQENIKQTEAAMQRRQSDLEQSAEDGVHRQIRASIDQAIWQKNMEIRTQEHFTSNLNKRFREQIQDAGDRTLKIVDTTFQQEQLRRINGVLDLLQSRVVELQTEMNAPPQVQLRKRAMVPTAPKTAKRIPFALIGAMACLFAPLFLGVAIERMKPRLYHVSQIRRAIPDVLIGEIMEPPVSWVHGSSFRKRLARYRESVHSWCAHLLLSDPFRSCRTISVASVSGDDGKTFLAVQVAVAMAQMKSGPVLLIDGDMRVGRLHLLFGNEESGIGLADVLSFRYGSGEAVVMSETEPNLHLLSAGHLDVSPYELIGDGRFRELLDVLEQNYSLILVVVPPVTHAAEALVLSACTDSTLLCVRQGETVLAAMEDVYRKLVTTGSRVDGIVVKDIPYYQMAGKDGGFADKLEQIRLSHLLQYSE